MRLSLCLLIASLAAAPAHAAELTRLDGKDGKTRIDLVGEIQPGDVDKLKAIVQAANDAKRIVATIRLDSPGGNLLEGVQMAAIVRHGRISTAVLSGKTCASACFIAFAAGAEKYASYTARLGVHGASDEAGRETAQSSAATVTMGRVVKELGVPSGIIGKMVITPPTEMVWLTVDDLRSMNVTMMGKPLQLPSDQAPQSQLPQTITPNAQAGRQPQKPLPTWAEALKTAMDLSEAQNAGKGRYARGCQPENRTCYTGVYFRNKEGNDVLLRTTEDLQGKTIRREVCSFNTFNDIRTCHDWDTNVSRRSVKNMKGEWEGVDD